MARPITWQDVSGAHLGAPLAAAQAASEQVGRALTGLGNVATNFMDATREEATRNAVANIMNSADPMAAARAAPQGWQVDPLAVQQAAQVQDQVLRRNQATEASLAASKVNTALNEAQLADVVSTRNSAILADSVIRKMAKNGDITGLDITGPEWEGQDGVKAYSQVLAESDRRAGRAMQTEELNLQRARAGREAELKKVEDYLGRLTRYGGTQEGGAADPNTYPRYAEDLAVSMGVSPIHVGKGVLAIQDGLNRNKATSAELDRPVMHNGAPLEGIKNLAGDPFKTSKDSLSYRDIDKTLDVVAGRVKAQREEALSGIDMNIGKPSEYTGMDEGALAIKLASDINKKVDPMFDVDKDEMSQQIGAFKQAARKNHGTTITNEQAALLIMRVLGDEGFSGSLSDTSIVNSDEAKAGIKEFAEFNRGGGVEGRDRRYAETSKRFDDQLASITNERAKVSRNARYNDPVSDSTVNLVNRFTEDFFKPVREAVHADLAAGEKEKENARKAAELIESLKGAPATSKVLNRGPY